MNMQGNHIEKPSLIWLLMEGRMLMEMGTTLTLMPILKNSPKGDGHPVLVIPGLATTDFSTQILRKFLRDQNYGSHGWRLGRNSGYNQKMIKDLKERIENLYKKYGNRKVSLIGWSLGGVFAREISKEIPDKVRQVITLGSPIRGHLQAPTNADWVYELISGHKVTDINPDLVKTTKLPPPVPMTAIYSKSDGIVPWEIAIEAEEAEGIENIESGGSHFGLGHNPLVLACIANRLAQPEGSWYPFKKTKLWKKFF